MVHGGRNGEQGEAMSNMEMNISLKFVNTEGRRYQAFATSGDQSFSSTGSSLEIAGQRAVRGLLDGMATKSNSGGNGGGGVAIRRFVVTGGRLAGELVDGLQRIKLEDGSPGWMFRMSDGKILKDKEKWLSEILEDDEK